MEINGRVWGSLPLAVHSGMDFPGQLAELYLNGQRVNRVGPVTSYRIGVRSRNLGLDIPWMASVLLQRKRYPFLPIPSRLQGIKALFGLLNPAVKCDILSLDDPRPGWAEVSHIIAHFRHKWREVRKERRPETRGLRPLELTPPGQRTGWAPGMH